MSGWHGQRTLWLSLAIAAFALTANARADVVEMTGGGKLLVSSGFGSGQPLDLVSGDAESGIGSARMRLGGSAEAISLASDDGGIVLIAGAEAALAGPDGDGDGDPDGTDPDDDNDGTPDVDDAFPNDASEDTDTDGDGTGDNADSDDDNDGTPDDDDAFPQDDTESVDTDGDGTGNNADSDDDGDGFSDAMEAAAGSDPLDPASMPAIEVPALAPIGLGTLILILAGGAGVRLGRRRVRREEF